jgi:hypothetical protein
LADLGYSNVVEYEGGKQDWIDAGLPLEADGEGDVAAASEDERRAE